MQYVCERHSIYSCVIIPSLYVMLAIMLVKKTVNYFILKKLKLRINFAFHSQFLIFALFATILSFCLSSSNSFPNASQ